MQKRSDLLNKTFFLEVLMSQPAYVLDHKVRLDIPYIIFHTPTGRFITKKRSKC